jgi:hypothetical protein
MAIEYRLVRKGFYFKRLNEDDDKPIWTNLKRKAATFENKSQIEDIRKRYLGNSRYSIEETEIENDQENSNGKIE